MATSKADRDVKTIVRPANQLDAQTFFEADKCREVIHELQQCRCCSRCILRLIGVKGQSPYNKPDEVIAQFLDTQANGSTIPPCDAKPAGLDDGKPEISADQPEPLGETCGVCLGILQRPCQESHVKELAEQVREADFGFENFAIAMTLPLQLLLREHCIYLHLKSVYSKLYQTPLHSTIPTIKEVYKWVCGPVLGDALDVKFHFKSPMEIMVTFAHGETEQELAKLLQQSKDTEPSRKKRKFYNAVPKAPSKPEVVGILKDLTDSCFRELFVCPPSVPRSPCSTTVTCSYSAVYVAGRYNKYSRHLSQTPWLIAGERKTESSVQELVCDPIQELFKASDIRFSASGREDVDVRTLGTGRPFVVEILNSRRPIPSQAELLALQRSINKSTSDVAVRDLQCIDREDTNRLKDGEETKTKSYSALVWSPVEHTAEGLAFLADMKDLTLQQKTPVRVLHRRPLATRERIVHSMSTKVLDPHHFRLFLRTQAGTYIKEFVHGDFGRTVPSLGSLLKCDTDILELDVESVDLNWPPSLPDDDNDDSRGNDELAKATEEENDKT